MYLISYISIFTFFVTFGCKNKISKCGLLENINTNSDTIVLIDLPECVGCFNSLPLIINNIGHKIKYIYINSNSAQYNILKSMKDIKPDIYLNKWSDIYKFKKGYITYISAKKCKIIFEYSQDQIYRLGYY